MAGIAIPTTSENNKTLNTMALEINQSNFAELKASDKLLVIDFWAEWCGPCRMITPIIEELAAEYADQANIGKCDVDSNDEIATEYAIRNIPTIIFVKGGKVVDKQVGATTKAALADKIKKNL
ncbi:Thioredoxin [Mucinivorans hirudinis]|uniref:Thioredoxin n=1 Tax=Mucinivorans hirudinis TaxID=1433126 RepID=A0A060R9C5_9BACT|nr:Thioredoxin [Mucinivorans hirudinis]